MQTFSKSSNLPPVIEPSEIITDRSGTINEESFVPHPWPRFLARFFDYSLWLLLLILLRFILGYFELRKGVRPLVPWEFLAWVPLESLFLATWGTTIGKKFFKIGMRQGKRRKLSFLTACKRSFNVWFRGVGLMIPFLNAFCMFLAYSRLMQTKTTSWDKEEGIKIVCLPINRWRFYLAASFSFLLFILYYRIR